METKTGNLALKPNAKSTAVMTHLSEDRLLLVLIDLTIRASADFCDPA